MKTRIIIIILLLPMSVICQEISVKSMPYFSTTRGFDREHYVKGFIIGADYSMNQDQVIKKYLDFEFEYANMESAQRASNTYMYSVIIGHKIMTDYNFFSSFRLRYSYASRSVSFGNNAYPINSAETTNGLKYHCAGAELILGKRVFFVKEGRLYLDLGVGGSYNHTLLTNMSIIYEDDNLPLFWSKFILQLGCKF